MSAPMVRALLLGTKTQTRRIVKRPDGIAKSGPGVTSPYGVVGDRLWVRETHAQFSVGNRTGDAPQCVAYRATCDGDGSFDYVNNGDEIMNLRVTKWTPAIFMPRWASRITLEITGLRPGLARGAPAEWLTTVDLDELREVVSEWDTEKDRLRRGGGATPAAARAFFYLRDLLRSGKLGRR